MGKDHEARDAWQEKLAADPPDHDDWFGYAELCLFLGDEADYRRAPPRLLARFGKATTRRHRTDRSACLLLPATGDELRQPSR